MSNPPLPRLLAIDELAIQLGTSVRHLRRLVAERPIPFVKLGGKLRFDSAEIAVWVDRGRVHDHAVRDRRMNGGIEAASSYRADQRRH